MYPNTNNNVNTNTNPCDITPIVCPERVCVMHCTHRYNQPVIIPVRTHIVHHYVPQYCYQIAKTVSEENVCCNQQQDLR